MKNKKTLIGVLSVTMLLSGLTLAGCGKDNTENKEAQSYTITYNLNGGTNANTNPSSYKSDSEDITLASASKEGYTFDGWYTTNTFESGTKVEKITKGSSGNKTLYAKFTAINYTITYNYGDIADVTNTNPTTYTIESSAITLAAPTKTNYHFDGWYTTATFDNGTKVETIATGSTGNKTLYAKMQTITLLNSSKSLKEVADDEIDAIKTNAYNLPHVGAEETETKFYGVNELNGIIETEPMGSKHRIDYYVPVGTLTNISTITSLKIGDAQFTNDDLVTFSIGNYNFIRDTAFIVSGNALYVAAPILAYNGSMATTITINGVDYAFEYQEDDSARVVTNVTQTKPTNGEITVAHTDGGEANEFDVTYQRTASAARGGVIFSYDGVSADDLFVAKDGDKAYGFTPVDTYDGVMGYGVYLLPFGMDLSSDAADAYEDAIYEFVVCTSSGKKITIKAHIKFAN